MKKMTTWIKVLSGSLLAVAFLVIAGVLCPTDAYAGGYGAALVADFGVYDEQGSLQKLDDELLSETYAEVVTPSGSTIALTDIHDLSDEYTGCPDCWIASDMNKLPEVGTYRLLQSTLQIPDGYELDAALGLSWTYEVTEKMLEDYKNNAMSSAGHDDYVFQIPVKKVGTTSEVLSPITQTPTLSLENVGATRKRIRASYQSYYSRNSAIQFGLEFSYSDKADGTYQQLVEWTTGNTLDDLLGYSQLKNGKTYYICARIVKTVNGQKVYGPYSDPLKYTVQYPQLDNTIVPAISGGTNLVTFSTKRVSVNNQNLPCKVIVYYATSAKGTYKKLTTLSEGQRLLLSQYSQLKKGKTYYFKGRYFLSYTLNGCKVSSRSGASKAVAVKKIK